MQVFQSLHFKSRDFSKQVRISDWPRKHLEPAIGFGIHFLDNLLSNEEKPSKNGLKQGSVTSLIGDDGTHKTQVAQAFLRNNYANLPQLLRAVFRLADALAGSQSVKATIESLPELEEVSLRDWANPLVERTMKYVLLQAWGEITATPGSQPSIRDWFEGVCKNRSRLKDPDKLADIDSGSTSRGTALARGEPSAFYLEPEGTKEEHVLAIACVILREVPGLLIPGVLITTEDHLAERLAEQVLLQHDIELKDIFRSTTHARSHLRRVLERLLLVRRVELHDASTAQLLHLIERCVVASLKPFYRIAGLAADPQDGEWDQVKPIDGAGLVRLVIGDLRLFRETFPDMMRDKLFLPALVFRLRRKGVTTLLVDSDEGRPDRTPATPFNAELRSLVDHQLYTWRVLFFGGNRVAIAVIPPLIPENEGIIRELRVERSRHEGSGLPRVIVNPHFELYSGIEEGRPVPVPLQVLLYAETKAFEEYSTAENALFRRLFSALQGFGNPVIEVSASKDYGGLRDYCQVPTETKLPYSLIFVVDGYWSKRGALRGQKAYLNDLVTLNAEGSAAERYADFIDVFKLYRQTHLFHERRSKPAPKETRRLDFFQQRKNKPDAFLYQNRIAAQAEVDRVPFSWDFGFLLCNELEWKNAFNISIDVWRDGKKVPLKVRDIWKALPRIESPVISSGSAEDLPKVTEMCSESQEPISLRGGLHFEESRDSGLAKWRYFLEACKKVAEVEERRSGRKVIAFDLAMIAPDSLSCLFFEIWASEIVETILRVRKGREGNEERADRWVNQAETRLKQFSAAKFDPSKLGGDLSSWLLPFEGDQKTVAQR